MIERTIGRRARRRTAPRSRDAARAAAWRAAGAALATLLAAGAGAPAAAAGGPEPAAPSAPTTAAPTWSWPIDGERRVLRPFLLEHPYAAGHRGIDLAASPGAVIRSPADGTVRFAGWVVDRPVLSIEHGGGLVSSYEPVDALVSTGDRVTRGQVVGELAASPEHAPAGGLHFGARLAGGYIDPMGLLAEIPRAVLLPLEAPSSPTAAGAGAGAALAAGGTTSTATTNARRRGPARRPHQEGRP